MRVPHPQRPGRRMQELRGDATTTAQLLAMAAWLRHWHVQRVVLLSRINAYVMRWIRNKYKRLRATKKAKACWQRITCQHPRLFAYGAWVHGSWGQG